MATTVPLWKANTIQPINVDDLSEEAEIAYRAFVNTGESKAAYFLLLQELDIKYKQCGDSGIAENIQLEKLLKRHDKNVMAAVTDSDSRSALIQFMS